MELQQVLDESRGYARQNIKDIFEKHGASEPCWGVKVGDLKKIEKKIRRNQALALELYDTGISDAMYLAGLVADGALMTREQLNEWAYKAPWSMISEYSVPWVAAEHPQALEIGLEWIESPREMVQAAGWNTLNGVASMRPDSELDMELFASLLQRIETEIHTAPNRVRYAMNTFVIGAGASLKELTDLAMEIARKIGSVEVDVGGTSCKVPYAPDYLQKIIGMGRVGKKRKTMKC